MLTINLGAVTDTPLGAALTVLHGIHVVLTLAQLEESDTAWHSEDVFVCENPSHALLRPLTIRRRTVSGALAETLARIGCLVPEELVLDGLLEDLRRKDDA